MGTGSLRSAYPHKEITGKVASGQGKGAFFTKLDWLLEQCRAKLGFQPFPGTLNLVVNGRDLTAVRELALREGVSLVPPDEQFCPAKCLTVRLAGVRGALVLPLVTEYYQDIVEVIAPVKLREVLSLSDGDAITFSTGAPPALLSLKDPGAVIFDLDGTLIDSIPLYIEIFEKALTRIGLPLPKRDTVIEIMAWGKPFWNVWNEILKTSRPEKAAEGLTDQFKAVFYHVWNELYLSKARTVSGVAETCELLSRRDVILAVASSVSVPDEALQVLRRGSLDPSLFKAFVTRHDVARVKPAPDQILECAKRIGVDPEKCIYVGDAPIDVISAKAAGAGMVAVLTGAGTRASLAEAGPDLILNSVVELPAALAGV